MGKSIIAAWLVMCIRDGVIFLGRSVVPGGGILHVPKVLSKAHMIGAICSRGRIVWQLRPHMSRSVDGVLGVVWIDLKMIRGEKKIATPS
jgi:hypothetical protein